MNTVFMMWVCFSSFLCRFFTVYSCTWVFRHWKTFRWVFMLGCPGSLGCFLHYHCFEISQGLYFIVVRWLPYFSSVNVLSNDSEFRSEYITISFLEIHASVPLLKIFITTRMSPFWRIGRKFHKAYTVVLDCCFYLVLRFQFRKVTVSEFHLENIIISFQISRFSWWIGSWSSSCRLNTSPTTPTYATFVWIACIFSRSFSSCV